MIQQGKEEEAKLILRKIYEDDDYDNEIQALKESVELELKNTEKVSIMQLIKTTSVRRGLYAGVGLAFFQQFIGINTVMYYSPSIVQLAGFASNRTALLLSLITSGLNAFGSILSIYFIDKTGRKKLALISLIGVVFSLTLLTVTFREAEIHSPMVSVIESSSFNNTCPDFKTATMNNEKWNCMRCLKATSTSCGFCAAHNKVILVLPTFMKHRHHQTRTHFFQRCVRVSDLSRNISYINNIIEFETCSSHQGHV